MRLAIVGGRDFNDFGVLLDFLLEYMYDGLNNEFKMDTIVSGGARGADSLGKKFAIDYELCYLEFPADWNKYGKSAGFIRNQQIVGACDMVLAFWDGKSKGTQDTINKAKKAKRPTFIVYF